MDRHVARVTLVSLILVVSRQRMVNFWTKIGGGGGSYLGGRDVFRSSWCISEARLRSNLAIVMSAVHKSVFWGLWHWLSRITATFGGVAFIYYGPSLVLTGQPLLSNATNICLHRV